MLPLLVLLLVVDICLLHPETVDIDKEIVSRSTVPPKPWGVGQCPYINNGDLLQKLALTVTADQPTSALILVGPKDSGKSSAISILTPAWKEKGHIIIDIDLKGSENTLATRSLMNFASEGIYAYLRSVDTHSGTKSCILKYAKKNCSQFINPPLFSLVYGENFLWLVNFPVLVNWQTSCWVWMACVSFFLLALGIVCRKYDKHCCTVIPTTVALLAIIISISLSVLRHNIEDASELIDPLHRRILNGSWNSLICTCNAISMCAPQNRSVLIVREFMNMNEDDLLRLMKSLEKMKQKQVHFPVILETADFLWLDQSPVGKSSSSFEPYTVKPMSFEEGKKEIVERLKIWTLEEYTRIYEEIGGHMGSYSNLWEKVVLTNDLNQSLDELKHRARMQLVNCVRSITINDAGTDSVRKLFLSLSKNESLPVDLRYSLPEYIKSLIHCNILFIEGDSLSVQNRLLLNAIKEVYSNNFTAGTVH